eukprot:scaffold2102_cov161-Amphora_coffeaeformis.AAC.35
MHGPCGSKRTSTTSSNPPWWHEEEPIPNPLLPLDVTIPNSCFPASSGNHDQIAGSFARPSCHWFSKKTPATTEIAYRSKIAKFFDFIVK